MIKMTDTMPPLLTPLQDFAQDVSLRFSSPHTGEPEEQLRTPLDNFFVNAGEILQYSIAMIGETRIQGLGKPDFGVKNHGLLCGFVEVKHTGKGANPLHYKGHDKKQWERFKNFPNILYTDGNEWALFQNGEYALPLVRLHDDIICKGAKAATRENALALEKMLRLFFEWEPYPPRSAQELAAQLAPLCRLLRDDVYEAVQLPDMTLLAHEWRKMLFPEATDAQFADSFAQTVTFALLLAREEGADTNIIENAVATLKTGHALLSDTLHAVAHTTQLRTSINASLTMLQRVIAAVDESLWRGKKAEPWLYFYEDFLAVYDAKLRTDAGVYYTPYQVVQAQVRLTDEILKTRLGEKEGFCSPDVYTLDPAVGTGTYLLGIIRHALDPVVAQEGQGAVGGHATELAKNLCGFEMLVGPYSVAQLRVSRMLHDYGAHLPTEGVGVYLTNTLESPHTAPPQIPLFLRALAEEHTRALHIKDKVPVLVCIGNPPYDRHATSTTQDRNASGGWVRWGDADGKGGTEEDKSIFQDFLRPAREAGFGINLRNLYNLYVYFWRWALWKLFDNKNAPAHKGIASFITASSYLMGKAFAGMREHIRRVCEEVWIIDLGGEGRGPRKDDNVFTIQTPVAIMITLNTGKKNRNGPAKVNYTRITGTKKEKLTKLEHITCLESLFWQQCPTEWLAPFKPAGIGPYFTMPLLTDLLPWQQTGIQFKRTWPIAPDKQTLMRRWSALLASKEKNILFKETRDRKIHAEYACIFTGESLQSLESLQKDATSLEPVLYAYRSFDRQYCLPDGRLGDVLSKALWRSYSEKQLYFSTLMSSPLGIGPALYVSACLPDLDIFRGSFGAKNIFPLYRNADATEPNFAPEWLDVLSRHYNRTISPEDMAAYLYGILAHADFTKRFHAELESREVRVPITKDYSLFAEVARIGRKLICLHTYGERPCGESMSPNGVQAGNIPQGVVRCIAAIAPTPNGYPKEYSYDAHTQKLRVGTGVFSPVAPAIWDFAISGFKVVQSWLKYRIKGGKKSSPLDNIRPEQWTKDYTSEFLRLLWILESTHGLYPIQAKLLEKIVSADMFTAHDFPPVPDSARETPEEGRTTVQQGSFGT